VVLWLAVKWLVLAIFALSMVLQCVGLVLRGKAQSRLLIISALVLVIMRLPGAAAKVFGDVVTMRASWAVAGAGVVGSVFVLLRLPHQKDEVVLRAGG
jgi:hypothetical protein